MIRPSLRAVLVHFSTTTSSTTTTSTTDGFAVSWNTDFQGDEKRAAYHAQKMASKNERPARQMQALGQRVPTGWVEHIQVSL